MNLTLHEPVKVNVVKLSAICFSTSRSLTLRKIEQFELKKRYKDVFHMISKYFLLNYI
jgi:hypothetical protein